jgi:hypothetical protein
MKLSALATLVFLTTAAQADLLQDFRKLDSNRKGPFSVNYQQGTESRAVTGQGWPRGKHLFQAAYRDEKSGRVLAEQYDFYVANLFTTNYFELMGEYVYGDAYGSHGLDHKALLNNAKQALPKAMSMVRHWSIEREYVHQFPESIIAKGFRTYGVSDTANEIEFANYFFNFFLSATPDDYAYLSAFVLLKQSPVGRGAAIDEARNLVANSYDYFAKRFGEGDPLVKALREIRNAVHNQMSPQIIGLIDRFADAFPLYKKEGHTYLFKVQDILREYYAIEASRIAKLAKAVGASEVESIAADIDKNGASAESLLALSDAGADFRRNLSRVPYGLKTQSLEMLSQLTQFLNKEVTSMKSIRSIEIVKVVFNAVYIEGFLIEDNWAAYMADLSKMNKPSQAKASLAEVMEIGQITLTEAFSPSLDQWVSIEPKMEYFIDNTIKSSVLNTAAIVSERLKD